MQQSPVLNAVNAVLVVAVALPAVLATRALIQHCDIAEHTERIDPSALELSDLWSKDLYCRLYLLHPISYVNVVFFFNVCVLFWLISLVQKSTWLIDPYWTIIPPLINLCYMYHPLTQADEHRQLISFALVMIWSIRLTHSYFRREEWQFGVREDWRFTKMQQADPRNWWWKCFFITYVSQQPMLVGVCLPLWAINFDAAKTPFSPLDLLATILCVAGLTIAYFADTQLREFMLENEARAAMGKGPIPLLYRGLWKYSRHPNYFGEQLWWWSLVLYAVVVHQGWTVIGTLFNSIVMAQVTVMTEQKMVEKPSRREAYAAYQKATSVWLPLPPGHLDPKYYTPDSDKAKKEK